MIQQPVPFLANIILVARAKGGLSPSELSQLESIRSVLKLKKADLNSAIKLVEAGGHKMTPVGSFVEQARNLEFILMVAYSDKDLTEEENSLVDEFARVAGISPEQLARIRADVIASMNRQEKVCQSCGTSSNKDARFCPNCGNNLEQPAASETIQPDFKAPNSGLAIEFAESTAASFPKALEIAKSSSGFQSCQKGKRMWYLATYPVSAIADAIPLCSALSGIRNRRLYVEGKETPWDEIFGFVWCADRRSTAYRPIEYCFGKDENRINPWGCRQANMEWSDWARWFCYGRWEKAGLFSGKMRWVFDKERIQHELATNLFRYRFCPHLQIGLSEAVIRHLPETITPESDRNWGYHRGLDEAPGSIKVVEKRDSSGFSFSNEYWSDGVFPKGLDGLKDILMKAAYDIGSNSESISNLLK